MSRTNHRYLDGKVKMTMMITTTTTEMRGTAGTIIGYEFDERNLWICKGSHGCPEERRRIRRKICGADNLGSRTESKRLVVDRKEIENPFYVPIS